MYRKLFGLGGALLVAAVLVFLTPGPSHAFPRGGHSGGPHGGVRGSHGGFRGGLHSGGYHSYGHRPYHHYPSNYFPSYYGYYPSYYNSYPYTYDIYPYSDPDLWAGPADGPANSSSSYPPGPASPAQAGTPAHLTVNLPAGAQLWFGGRPAASTGTVREVDSPPLTPGHRYTYELRARWNEGGRAVTQTREVEVTAGEHVTLNFPSLPIPRKRTSAVKKG